MITSELNNGGRVSFERDSEVRILELDGSISRDTYRVDQERSDRKGHVTLRGSVNSNRLVKVHHRRVLVKSIDGKGLVVGSEGRYLGICPVCGVPNQVHNGDPQSLCQKCGPYQLHWFGEQMSDAVATEKVKTPKIEKVTEKPATAEKETTTTATAAAAKPAKEPKAEKAVKAARVKPEKPAKEPKPPKVQKEPSKVDIDAVVKLENCKLYVKKNVKWSFQNPGVELRSHTLIYTGENPRKICFNTYNGNLGKKVTLADFDKLLAAFVATTDANGKNTGNQWFPVENVEQAVAKLKKDGYELAE